MDLIQGQTDFRIRVLVDYQDGSQISQAELEAAKSIKIMYQYLSYDGTDYIPASWDATSYGVMADGRPYVEYLSTSADQVPLDASKLIGRVVITDDTGLISKGTQFEINVLPDTIIEPEEEEG